MGGVLKFFLNVSYFKSIKFISVQKVSTVYYIIHSFTLYLLSPCYVQDALLGRVSEKRNTSSSLESNIRGCAERFLQDE